MKKLYIISLILIVCFLGGILYSQIYFDEIVVNKIKIKPITSNGYVGNYSNLYGAYYAPVDSTTQVCRGSALWLGGLDAGGQLHLAAQTYAQIGSDFKYGPYPSAPFSWNKLWKVRKSMVDSFRLNLYSTIPLPIAQWPTHGNVSLGHASHLAPFKDLNNNGVYEPQFGDYPCIKGDEAIFAIYNDNTSHTETQGLPLGVEVHQMIYGFNMPNDSALNNTLFFQYRIINRSANTYNPFFVTWWSDLDMGFCWDDFAGSDIQRNAVFIYDGDGYDFEFGDYPACAGYTFLDFPLAIPNDGIDNNKDCIIDEPNEPSGLAYIMYYNNGGYPDSSATSNPTTTVHYWNYMQSIWKNGTPLKRTGNGYNSSSLPAYKYAFPDSSDNQYGWGSNGNCSSPVTYTNSWDEISAGNSPHDRRIVSTIGPLILPPSGEVCFSFAFIFAENNNHFQDNVYAVRLFKRRVEQVQNFFQANHLAGCDCSILTETEEMKNTSFVEKVYPNPAYEYLNIHLNTNQKISRLYLTDISGRIYEYSVKFSANSNNLLQMDISSLPNGYYILVLQNDLYQKTHLPIIVQH
ncbi:MAG: T9SS type A sorting domain-containing protein [Spirochaetes bacterium]|nr:T9SS type A sorting domain-containing protein [Spirochaetota bacterium]